MMSSLYPSTNRRKSKARFLGKYWLPLGLFVFLWKPLLSQHLLMRFGEAASIVTLASGEGTGHQGSIKTITPFLSKCWAMPGTKQGKWEFLTDGSSEWEKKQKKDRTVTETYPFVAHNNSKKHGFLWWHLTWHLSTSISWFNLFH